MGAAVTFGSQEFLALPRKQQNEVVFKLLSPLARWVGWINELGGSTAQNVGLISRGRFSGCEPRGMRCGRGWPCWRRSQVTQGERTRKSCIRETQNLSTCADSSNDIKKFKKV